MQDSKILDSFYNLHFISDHPKGYLTKITTDYEAKHDEELSVQKGTMVKVSNCHHRGNGIQLSAV